MAMHCSGPGTTPFRHHHYLVRCYQCLNFFINFVSSQVPISDLLILSRPPIITKILDVSPTKKLPEYEGKVKSSRPSLRETRDKRPLGRDLDGSWCHLHTSVKHFWSQPNDPWTSWSKIGEQIIYFLV